MSSQKRKAGVLLNISSLPGPFGVGVFGREAKEFIDVISEAGFRIWQILPLGSLDSGNSPYAADSAFAGNILYIDPRFLEEKNWITKEELRECIYSGTPFTAEYKFASESKNKVLKKAFKRIGSDVMADIEKFAEENAWLEEYSLFKAVKDRFNGASWMGWPEEYSDYETCVKHKEEFKESMDFHKFVQYVFFKQWKDIKEYANSRKVEIVGDMPVYMAPDSCDVWAHTELFQIDAESKRLKQVAGVPPDYFSEDGQLWGNPLYDWEKMEQENFKWWVERIGFALSIYDTVRIDHFRGLASYWAVPTEAKSAKEGHWEEGPGQKLFDAVSEKYSSPSIIAEDLGAFGEDVVSLLNSTGFPGMRVIQFGFDPYSNSSSTHLPHNYPFNCYAYLGTHDNNTLLGWLWEATPDEREFALYYCGFKGEDWGKGGYESESCRCIIETVWRSSANVVIISFQDMCGFGSDARMNIPGVPEMNWRFRTTKETILSMDSDYFRRINGLFGRI
ncbi:MAG: 4-alpha-glucanotransferase [Clostridia bacterium]|nr:4-alpha-glucanotransferase [Clostridia bacterium]